MRAVNLIPSEQRGGASVGAGRSGGGAYAVVGLLAGLAILALLYGMAHHQVSSRRAQAETLSAQAQQAQLAAGRLAPYTSFVALREARMQAFTQLADSRFDWAHAFHEFGRVLPPQVSITSLNGTVGSASEAASTTSTGTAGASSVASATPPGTVPTFTLQGCAVSQPAVALMLERLRLIDGVKEVVLQSATKGSVGSSGSAAGGGCPPKAVTFSSEVNFAPLPATSASSAPTTAVADTTPTQGAAK
jgi:Tfp pilus assembly protein PilN